MEIDQAEATLLLKRARSDRDVATAEMARLETLRAQATGLARFIEGLELMFPALAEENPHDKLERRTAEALDPNAHPRVERLATDQPRATDAVSIILREQRDRWFTGRQMIDEFNRRQIKATETAIRLALKRAAEKGTAERQFADDGSHIFRIRQEEAVEQEVSTS